MFRKILFSSLFATQVSLLLGTILLTQVSSAAVLDARPESDLYLVAWRLDKLEKDVASIQTDHSRITWLLIGNLAAVIATMWLHKRHKVKPELAE